MNKTPDTIYLVIGPMSGDEPNKRYLYAEWYEEPKPSVENIKYIRRDALLEWAKEKEDYALTREVKLAYKTMIEKLNAM